jgi:hypothetical protein
MYSFSHMNEREIDYYYVRKVLPFSLSDASLLQFSHEPSSKNNMQKDCTHEATMNQRRVNKLLYALTQRTRRDRGE